jgi:hypothetical protein
MQRGRLGGCAAVPQLLGDGLAVARTRRRAKPPREPVVT